MGGAESKDSMPNLPAPAPAELPPPASPPPPPTASICDKPFDSDFSRLTTEQVMNSAAEYKSCLNKKTNEVRVRLDKMINQYQNRNDNLSTAEEANSETMNLYMKDYYYVLSKGVLYLIVMGCFIYFFGINNLVEGIKTTGEVIKDKAVIIKDKAVELKDKAVELQDKADLK